MQTAHQAALQEVLRINARLTAVGISQNAEERLLVPAVREELEQARAILALERGLATYVKKGGRDELSPGQIEALIDHIRNREGHMQ